jgi:hypothetical protein
VEATGFVILHQVPAGWERGAFIAWLQRDGAVLVADMCDAPSGVPTHITVKRAASGVACWSMTSIGEAFEHARECNKLWPADPAHVWAWDDSVWDAVLGASPAEGK